MPIVDLDQRQGFALLSEITSTRNLLAYGVRAIRTSEFIETTRDPILTMLSIGVEKLYKLSLGLFTLKDKHQWPSKAEMKAHGHRLADMHDVVMHELHVRTAEKSEYIQDLVRSLANDPVLLPTIQTLDVYGRRGRFYNLDQLGNDPQPVNPELAWSEIEKAALLDPEVARLRKVSLDALGDQAALDSAVAALHERIALSVEQLWVTLAMCGMNHVLEESGRTFGSEVHPDAVGRQEWERNGRR